MAAGAVGILAGLQDPLISSIIRAAILKLALFPERWCTGEMGKGKRYRSVKLHPLLAVKPAGEAKQNLSGKGSGTGPMQGAFGLFTHRQQACCLLSPERWEVKTTFPEAETERPKQGLRSEEDLIAQSFFQMALGVQDGTIAK